MVRYILVLCVLFLNCAIGFSRDSGAKRPVHVKRGTDVSLLNKPDRIYVFEFDHHIDNNWVVPDNCTLDFRGGTITGGLLYGSGTDIVSAKDTFVIGSVVKGSWSVSGWKPEWFRNSGTEYWNEALQKCIDLSGSTGIPVLLTGSEYLLDNYERTAPTKANPEPDCYNSLLNICSGMTIVSKNKSRVKVKPIAMHSGRYYTAVFGHRYEGCGDYPSTKTIKNITFDGIVIDNYDDSLAEAPKSSIINKYCIYGYNVSNLTVQNCELYCSGSNCLFMDVAYKRGGVRSYEGIAQNCIIRNNYFRIKEKEFPYDLSALFVAIENTEIYDNVIEHNYRAEARDRWGCAGIEIHAGRFKVYNNRIIGFNNGINDCNYVGPTRGIHDIYGNKFEDCYAPLALWSYGSPKLFSALTDVSFHNNVCTQCRQPVRSNSTDQSMNGIKVYDNEFHCETVRGGAVSFSRIENGLDISFVGNSFWNANPTPFFEFQAKSGMEKYEKSNIVVESNYFDCFNDTSSGYPFFYFVPRNRDTRLEIRGNKFRMPKSVEKPLVLKADIPLDQVIWSEDNEIIKVMQIY